MHKTADVLIQSMTSETAPSGLASFELLVRGLADIGLCDPAAVSRLQTAMVGWEELNQEVLAERSVRLLVRRWLPSVLRCVSALFSYPDCSTALSNAASDCEIHGNVNAVAETIAACDFAARTAGALAEEAIQSGDEQRYAAMRALNGAASNARNTAYAARTALKDPGVVALTWGVGFGADTVCSFWKGEQDVASRTSLNKFVEDVVELLVELDCPGAKNL